MYAWQHVQPTGTNRPRAWIERSCLLWSPRGATHPLTTDFGGHGDRVTPVPIPNTEVKPVSADGTWGLTPWESRTPPDFARRALLPGGAPFRVARSMSQCPVPVVHRRADAAAKRAAAVAQRLAAAEVTDRYVNSAHRRRPSGGRRRSTPLVLVAPLATRTPSGPRSRPAQLTRGSTKAPCATRPPARRAAPQYRLDLLGAGARSIRTPWAPSNPTSATRAAPAN